jgi:hypothetical protein
MIDDSCHVSGMNVVITVDDICHIQGMNETLGMLVIPNFAHI